MELGAGTSDGGAALSTGRPARRQWARSCAVRLCQGLRGCHAPHPPVLAPLGQQMVASLTLAECRLVSAARARRQTDGQQTNGKNFSTTHPSSDDPLRRKQGACGRCRATVDVEMTSVARTMTTRVRSDRKVYPKRVRQWLRLEDEARERSRPPQLRPGNYAADPFTRQSCSRTALTARLNEHVQAANAAQRHGRLGSLARSHRLQHSALL